MLKLTKKADYGLIALRHLASGRRSGASAKDIAEAYRIPLPLLSKVLQKLAKAGLLLSEQGTNGGYRLARDPHEISALEVIRTLDGPIILTHCFTEHAEPVECAQSTLCPVREPLRKVHEGILRLLSGISIFDMSQEESPIPVMVSSIQSFGAPEPQSLPRQTGN
ncbi:MAG TPA: Rrf2 family transcriptional regulator [Bryobacteraceae bacterium]|jgi:Rrf2 family protein